MKRKFLFLLSAVFTAVMLLSLNSCHDCDNDPAAKQVTLQSGESCPSYCSGQGYKRSQTIGKGFSQDCCCF